jgi:hypothetical protein
MDCDILFQASSAKSTRTMSYDLQGDTVTMDIPAEQSGTEKVSTQVRGDGLWGFGRTTRIIPSSEYWSGSFSGTSATLNYHYHDQLQDIFCSSLSVAASAQPF